MLTAGATSIAFRRLFPPDGLTLVETGLLVLLPVLAAWVAANFWIATFGTVSLLAAGRTRPPDRRVAAPAGARLAVVMPVHNEDPARVSAGLARIAASLDAEPALAGFHMVVLSDTRDDRIARAEAAAWRALRDTAGFGGRLFYRRRRVNAGRKAGNIQDFCERWGGHYDYMLVLDADSLMDGPAVAAMLAEMQADPRLALLQSWPRPAMAETVFGRLQQFATSVHGRQIAEGLRLLLGDEATYWGHNALIRVAAFAACCGLPPLPGRPPLGGEVLGQDFVEAALLGAGGWKVRIATERLASYEEAPPSLIAAAVRDRRWCQGNLQHVRLVAAQGLVLPSRLHFAMGAMAYLSAPLWCLFLALGIVEVATAQAVLAAGPTAQPISLPILRQADRLLLIGVPLVTPFAPKFYGLLLAAADPWLRRAHGGLPRLAAGVLLEVVVTTLTAPVMALLHSRFVAEILLGRSCGWSAQRRGGRGESLAEVAAAHWAHSLAGAAVVLAVAWTAPQALLWVLPVCLGLVLSIPLSWASNSRMLGGAARRLGLLSVPEELAPPGILLPRS